MQDFYTEVIGTRSFTSVWYWIVFAVVWGRATHWTLGVPYEDARLARKLGGEFQRDFEILLELHIRKTLRVFNEHGALLVALATFSLAMFGTLGFGFNLHFMQAGFLLVFPMALVNALTIKLAYRLAADPPDSGQLYRIYVRHRRVKQLIGAISILITSFWGVRQAFYNPFITG
jgi:hypothetical protein